MKEQDTKTTKVGLRDLKLSESDRSEIRRTKRPSRRLQIMEAIKSRVHALIQSRRSLLINAKDLHQDLVDSGAYARFGAEVSSIPLTVLGNVVGGHGFKAPFFRTSTNRFYILPIFLMTEEQRDEVRGLSRSELIAKVKEMESEYFDEGSQ